MTELEMICKKSGIEVSECDCALCQTMCKRAPCIGTPQDIVTLINNGYIHELEQTAYSAGNAIGIETFISIQIKEDHDHGGCPLLKNGKCSIHHIKPTDGKLASCKDLHYDRSRPSYLHLIAKAWESEENIQRMVFIFKSLYRYLDAVEKQKVNRQAPKESI